MAFNSDKPLSTKIMFCKYCGKPVDNDSIYCRYCGRQIEKDNNSFKSVSMHSLLISKDREYYGFPKVFLIKEKLFRILNFTWKVLKTIVLAIIGLFVYIIVGFLMSPLIALFNAEIPSLGFFDEIIKIWKKEKDNVDEVAE